MKQVLRHSDDFHRKWFFGEARRWEQADEAPIGGDVTASSRSDDGGHLEMTSRETEKTAASAILKSDDVTEEVGHLERVEKTAATNGDEVTVTSP